jgi:hypothetical protein
MTMRYRYCLDIIYLFGLRRYRLPEIKRVALPLFFDSVVLLILNFVNVDLDIGVSQKRFHQ